MKSLPCLIGLHSWNHCRCTRCGTLRDKGHDWEEGCKCAICGATRDAHHNRVRCSCTVCGTAMHDFVPADSHHHTCQRCAVREEHAFYSVCRWEDWGGWDSIGGWSAQENEYKVCHRCGYEEFVGFTGNIQV